MPTIWFNQGYSVVRDAILMIREGADAAGLDDLRIIASHADRHAPVLEAADDFFIEPAMGRAGPEADRDYAAWCADICARYGVDLFLVQGRQGSIARHLDLFPPTTRVAVRTDADTLGVISDKAAFHQIVTAAGLPMPWTAAISDAAGFDAALDALTARGRRVCVKPRQGVFGHGFWLLDPDVTLFDALMAGDDRRVAPADMRRAIAGATGPVRLLVMEYLAGPEWSLDCVCDQGAFVTGVARRKRGRVQELEVDGPIFDMARAAIELFGLSGLVNVQFRASDLEGTDPRLLEINPRMSGGIARSRFAGVNLPWRNLALRLGLDHPAEAPVGGALIAAHETGISLRAGKDEAVRA